MEALHPSRAERPELPGIMKAASPASDRLASSARRRDRQATEAALVAAAAALFAERGFEATTTKSVAERAGCSEALIQAYFKGKEGLLLAVIGREGGGHAEQAAFFDRPLRASLEEEGRETLSHLVGNLERCSTGLRIVLSRVLVDPQFKEEFNRVTIRTTIYAGLVARFGRYAEAGLLDPSFEAGSAAELLISLAFQLGFIHRQVLRTDPAEVNRRIGEFAAMFGRAVSPARWRLKTGPA